MVANTLPFSEALIELRFTKEQARYLQELIGGTEAQLGVLADALTVLNHMLRDDETGTRATYLLMVAQELRTNLALARISATQYQQAPAAVYRAEAMH